jgi:hypothetical protein
MNATTATLLAAPIGGGLALVGVFVERFLRSLGRLWFVSSGWDMRFYLNGFVQEVEGGFVQEVEEGEVEPERVKDVRSVQYFVNLDLFNGKEIPVGLRAVSVVFTCDGGEVTNTPEDVPWSAERRARARRSEEDSDHAVRVLNLAPRQWVRKELVGWIARRDKPEAIRLLGGWRQVEFVGQRQRRGLFERKEFRRTIASRPPFPDPWKRES